MQLSSCDAMNHVSIGVVYLPTNFTVSCARSREKPKFV